MLSDKRHHDFNKKFAFLPSTCASCGRASFMESGWERVISYSPDYGNDTEWRCKECGPNSKAWENHPEARRYLNGRRKK